MFSHKKAKFSTSIHDDFFKHSNSPFPPSPFQEGQLEQCWIFPIPSEIPITPQSTLFNRLSYNCIAKFSEGLLLPIFSSFHLNFIYACILYTPPPGPSSPPIPPPPSFTFHLQGQINEEKLKRDCKHNCMCPSRQRFAMVPLKHFPDY